MAEHVDYYNAFSMLQMNMPTFSLHAFTPFVT